MHDDSYLPAPKPENPTAPESVPLSLGDLVLLKQPSPKSLELWWKGPFTVPKLLGHQCWYHLSKLKEHLPKMNGLSNNWDVPPSSSPESPNEGPGGPKQGPSSLHWAVSPLPMACPNNRTPSFLFAYFFVSPASSAFSRSRVFPGFLGNDVSSFKLPAEH